MSYLDRLFDKDARFKDVWWDEAREWASLQLECLPELAQEAVLTGFTAKMTDERDGRWWRERLHLAFSVKLPGPELPYNKIQEYVKFIHYSHWLILVRYFSLDPFAWAPRVATVHPQNPIQNRMAHPFTDPTHDQMLQEMASLPPKDKRTTTQALRAQELNENLDVGKTSTLAGLSLFWQQTGVSPMALHELNCAMDYVMAVARHESAFENPPSTRRLLYHQTGLDKQDDPYVSTSCVLPCLNQSTCKEVQKIRNEGTHIGFFLVPRNRVRVMWPGTEDEALELAKTAPSRGKEEDQKRRTQIEKSGLEMSNEREVAYLFPPPLNSPGCEICRIDNPFRGKATSASSKPSTGKGLTSASSKLSTGESSPTAKTAHKLSTKDDFLAVKRWHCPSCNGQVGDFAVQKTINTAKYKDMSRFKLNCPLCNLKSNSKSKGWLEPTSSS
jgi:hypothetical protein